MIKLKDDEGDPHEDLELWKWALEVIERLAADGMSSDESGGEESGVSQQDQLYQVKIMVWRRRMEDVLKLIDDCRHSENGIFSLRGYTGLKRKRPPTNAPGNWPVSHRPAMEQLPVVFYDEDWFKAVDINVRMTTLNVSAEQFRWALLHSRM